MNKEELTCRNCGIDDRLHVIIHESRLDCVCEKCALLPDPKPKAKPIYIWIEKNKRKGAYGT